MASSTTAGEIMETAAQDNDKDNDNAFMKI